MNRNKLSRAELAEWQREQARERRQRTVADRADEIVEAALAQGEPFSETLANRAINQAMDEAGL